MIRAACCLFAAASLLAACSPVNRHPQAPTPARSLESLSDEARARRLDLIDAVRLPDTARLRRTLASNAFMVRQAGDTVRGIDAIARDLLTLRASQPITTVRGIPTTAAVRCYDGILDRRDEWALTIMGADSIPRFVRGPMAIHWTTRGDSLAVGEIDLTGVPVTRDERMGCVNTDAVRYAIHRVELFYTMGLYTPTTYYGSASKKLHAAGYNQSSSPDQYTYPDGADARADQMVGVSARLNDHVWLTAATVSSPEQSDLGRCNPETFNYVHLGRSRRPWTVTLDARAFHGFSLGLGPAFAEERYSYKEVDFVPRPPDQIYFGRCESEVVTTAHDSTETRHRAVGEAGHFSYALPAGPHVAIIARAQFFRFPSAPSGVFTSRGLPIAFRDLATTFGAGVAFTY